MNNYTPNISIIIRTKNEERFIGQTLTAIFKQDIELPFEVIVIDSGSTDRTLDIVRQFKVRLYEIEPEKFSFGSALNYGARLALGEFIVNLSAHCIPVDSKWIVNLVTPLQADPCIAATYGNQVPIRRINPFEERSLIANFGYNGEAHFSNANCAIRKMVLEKYPFDEKAIFAEDFIWSQMLPSELKIQYVPDSAVYHSHPLTFKYWAKRYYDTGLVIQYMAHVYGLAYPFSRQSQQHDSKFAILERKLRTAWNYFVFLLRNRYFHYIPILPIYFILKSYYYHKGIKEGRRLYGSAFRGSPEDCEISMIEKKL